MLTIIQIILFWILIDVPYLTYRVFESFFSIRKKHLKKFPKVSILIPAYNEEDCISKTLESCVYQSYLNIEIIVINDGSTDDTAKEIAFFYRNNLNHLINRNISFNVIHQQNKGKSKALNSGLKKAEGEFIVTIDADSYISHKGIENILSYFVDESVGAVSGNIIGLRRKKLLDYLQYMEYELGILFLRKAQSYTQDVMVTPGAFSAYRKKALGRFEEGTITEDFDTSVRIIEKNYKIVEAINAVCYTQLPINVSDLIRQRIRWQQGGLQVLTKHILHNKRISAHLEMLFIFFFGFYGVFPRTISFIFIPLLIFSGNGGLLLVLAFFLYSYILLFIQFLSVYRHNKKKKMFLLIPLFIIYQYTLILYSCLVAQILLFNKEQRWSKLKRYRI